MEWKDQQTICGCKKQNKIKLKGNRLHLPAPFLLLRTAKCLGIELEWRQLLDFPGADEQLLLRLFTQQTTPQA
jgi:hypothetical protein